MIGDGLTALLGVIVGSVLSPLVLRSNNALDVRRNRLEEILALCLEGLNYIPEAGAVTSRDILEIPDLKVFRIEALVKLYAPEMQQQANYCVREFASFRKSMVDAIQSIAKMTKDNPGISCSFTGYPYKKLRDNFTELSDGIIKKFIRDFGTPHENIFRRIVRNVRNTFM